MEDKALIAGKEKLTAEGIIITDLKLVDNPTPGVYVFTGQESEGKLIAFDLSEVEDTGVFIPCLTIDSEVYFYNTMSELARHWHKHDIISWQLIQKSMLQLQHQVRISDLDKLALPQSGQEEGVKKMEMIYFLTFFSIKTSPQQVTNTLINIVSSEGFMLFSITLNLVLLYSIKKLRKGIMENV